MFKKLLTTLGITALAMCSSNANAATLALVDEPLFLNASVPPLNLLVMGRDHKLFYEAYNDHSDLDGDGALEFRFKPSITYFGYFDSNTCYTHDGSKFNPAATAADSGSNLKACGSGSQWSGNFLNYLTTTRIDALRKVLYGGYRSTDSSTATVLERAYVPQDAHSWGKEYTSVAVDGYDIRKYTPYDAPTVTGQRHLFANVTRLNSIASGPLLRVLTNRTERIWQWVSTERAVAGFCLLNGQDTNGANTCNGGSTAVTPTDLVVRVSVCVAGYDQPTCTKYPNGNYKPTGLLQQYGENDTMKFGLLSGSYQHNTDGGVLRKAVSSIKNEINWSTDGTFIAGANGIIQTINNFKITGFNQAGYSYNCGWITTRPINDGECQPWGNPIAEMMYEGLRYFSGASAPTPDFAITAGAGEESGLSLPVATWDSNTDPYKASNGNSRCSKPVEMVLSDVNASYDTDKLPGVNSNFAAGFTGTLGTLDVSSLGQSIWNNEFGSGTTKSIFIGQSGAVVDSAPTVKSATSFGNIRGLAPEEPTKKGGYYAASVALYGHNNDISTTTDPQKVSTFAVALASPLPRIDISTPNGKKITLVPFAKSVAGSSINAAGSFQPTNQIVDFYVDTLTPTSGKFRINYEDVEQGADHDMDAIVVYDYSVDPVTSAVTITLTSEYAAGGITQHMGYVISGTTSDGVYLDVRDADTAAGSDVDYALDTPNIAGTALPLTKTRVFTPGSSPGAELLHDPLWYAAKYGGFNDKNNNGMPDSGEWDSKIAGTPDNYYLVTNALTLGDQLAKAFKEIVGKVASASSASVNSGTVSTNTRLYQSKFVSLNWTGRLLSYKIDPNTGAINSTPEWDASKQLPLPAARQIITVNSNGAAVAFTSDPSTGIDSTRQSQLGTASTFTNVLNYLRGDSSKEGTDPADFRQRIGTDDDKKSYPNKLGDMIDSAPVYVGAPSSRYADSLESSPYSSFLSAKKNRDPMIYVGANDGMLHGFKASTGVEVFGFIPGTVFGNLKSLASQAYAHKYFIDGTPTVADVFTGGQWRTILVGGLNKGGQGIYALDVTDPSTLASAETNAASIFKWEFTDRSTSPVGDKDLGYTYSKPQIVRLNNGKWAAIFGNGYNNSAIDTDRCSTPSNCESTTGTASLFIVDIADGSLIKKIDTKKGIAATPNGLSTPSPVDINGDSITDYVYAGDLQGNLWKFDLTSTNASAWGSSYSSSGNPLPLYVAKDGASTPNTQPITTKPRVIRGPNGKGLMVLFGTGKYLESVDRNNPNPALKQSFYGIWDLNTGADSDRVSGRTALTQQSILAETTVGTTGVRITSALPFDAANKRGWFIDLFSPVISPQAELQVSDAVIRGDRVIFTTTIPESDPCAFGGKSWLMELDALSGSRLLETTPFDLNNDGLFSSADYVSYTDPVTGKTILVPVSGVSGDKDVGILTSPVIVDKNSTVEYKYNTGSSGATQKTVENADLLFGRQTWRQVR